MLLGCHNCSCRSSVPKNCCKPLQCSLCHRSRDAHSKPRFKACYLDRRPRAHSGSRTALARASRRRWLAPVQHYLQEPSLQEHSPPCWLGKGGRRQQRLCEGPSRMPAPLTAFPLSFFTLGLTGVYGFGGPYGETVATGAYRAFRVAAAAGHSGAFSGNDSNRTSKFQGGNYTQTPFLRASGNSFLHFTVWSEAFLLTAGLPFSLTVWALPL